MIKQLSLLLLASAFIYLAFAQTNTPINTHANAQNHTQDNTVENKKETLGESMQIKISAGEHTLYANLNNSKAAQDLMAMLPLTLTLTDYGQNEKVSDLPKKLSLQGSPSGYTPKTGDIAHYAPWGNFVIFRRDFSYSEGLIQLGEITQGLSAVDRSGPIEVTIERLTP